MTLAERIGMLIERLASDSPRILVCIDGPDAAGKTTVADAVVRHLAVPWLRASIDGFHQPRADRVEKGSLSPAGYFHDSFNYVALTEELLFPFQAGARFVQNRVFDWRADVPVEVEPRPLADRAVLVFDGVFLLRPERRRFWDLSVYLRVPPRVVLERALVRDAGALGSSDEVRQRYEDRYLPGQALYRAECDPEGHADVLVDNSDFSNPVVIRQAPDAS